MRRLLVLFGLALAACGDLPQPFRHEGINAAVAPPGPRVVVVRPPDQDTSGTALAQAIIKRLGDMDIPASTRSAVSGGWILAAQSTLQGSNRVLLWRLAAPGAAEQPPFPQTLPAALWDKAGPATITRMADEVVARFAPPLLGEEPAHAGSAALPPRVPVVRVAPLAGLPGDGNAALAKALGSALRRMGLRMGGAEADLEVRGRFALLPDGPGQERLEITWSVFDGRTGAELGMADQQGALPKGRLNGAWGGLAGDIAAGGADGIADIIAAAAQK